MKFDISHLYDYYYVFHSSNFILRYKCEVM